MAKRKFRFGNETYSKIENIGVGEQWRCHYNYTGHTEDAFVFIPKQDPTTLEIIEAFEDLEITSGN